MHVLELNDSEFRVAKDAKIVARSPGYAVVQDEVLRLGAEALKLAHLHPRQTYSRFWANLNEDTLAIPAGRFRHHADFAFAHLRALHEQAGKPAELILSVPGSFSNEQLSLLLGIVQALPFKAVGLVDSAVAAAAAVTSPGRYTHVDIHLHHTVITRIVAAADVVRESVETLDNGGMTGIHDAIAGLIGDLFIQQCRFDPLRHAETEQALYDQIPGCLRQLEGHSEVPLEIRHSGARNQVKLARETLLQRLDAIYQGMLQKREPHSVTLLGDRAAALPGFANLIPGACSLAAETVFRGCEEHRAAILSAGPHLNYVTRLPLPSKPAPELRQSAAELPTATSAAAAATHLLLGYRLFPLRPAPIFLAARGSVHPTRQETTSCSVAINGRHATLTPMSDTRIYLNGEPVSGARTLHAGDKLSFGGSDTVYSLVAMANPDAA